MNRSLTIAEVEAFEDRHNVGMFGLLRTCLRGDALRMAHVRALWPYVCPATEADPAEALARDPVAAHSAVEALLVRTLLPDAEARELLAEAKTDTDPDPTSAPGG